MSKPEIVRNHAAYAWAAYGWAFAFLIIAGVLIASSLQLAGSRNGELTVHAGSGEELRDEAPTP